MNMIANPDRSVKGRIAGITLAVLLAIANAGNASAIDWGPEAQREDAETCQAMGAGYGRDFTWCMMQQQQRRDDALHNAAEQQLNNAAAAALNLQTVRRMRCQRAAEAALDRGEQPQFCP
jgi:hypothetical protein